MRFHSCKKKKSVRISKSYYFDTFYLINIALIMKRPNLKLRQVGKYIYRTPAATLKCLRLWMW
jgi:hypothetical protein